MGGDSEDEVIRRDGSAVGSVDPAGGPHASAAPQERPRGTTRSRRLPRRTGGVGSQPHALRVARCPGRGGGLRVHHFSIANLLAKLGFTYKKVAGGQQRSCTDVRQARRDWLHRRRLAVQHSRSRSCSSTKPPCGPT